MRILILGDSITAGAGASSTEKQYTALLRKHLQCDVEVFGEGGTRIAKQRVPSAEARYDRDFLMRSEAMQGRADLVIVFGGTNDYGHGDAPIGEVDSRDEYTFCGAVNSLIEKLSAKFTKERLCFILPLHRYNEENPYGEGDKKIPVAPLAEYVKNLKTILELQGVKYMCFDDVFPVPMTCEGDELTSDGLHPNDKGHALLAEKICAYIRTKIKTE